MLTRTRVEAVKSGAGAPLTGTKNCIVPHRIGEGRGAREGRRPGRADEDEDEDPARRPDDSWTRDRTPLSIAVRFQCVRYQPMHSRPSPTGTRLLQRARHHPTRPSRGAASLEDRSENSLSVQGGESNGYTDDVTRGGPTALQIGEPTALHLAAEHRERAKRGQSRSDRPPSHGGRILAGTYWRSP